MASIPASNAGLKKRFRDDLIGGRNIMQLICVTATGTGLGTTGYRLGQSVLDSSSGKWFICSVTAGSGTWIALNP